MPERNLLAMTMVRGRRPRRQGYEAGGSISAHRHVGQGRVMIDDIQNLRLILSDLGIDMRDRRGRRGIDAGYQRGFVVQETDDVLDIMEGLPREPLVRDRVLETRLGRRQIIEDGLLVAGIDTADE